MALTFLEFKEGVKNRKFGVNNRLFNAMIKEINDFILEEEIEFFYPKNISNSKGEEFIIFTNSKIITISSNEEKVSFKVNPFKIASFHFDTPRYDQDSIYLQLILEDGSLFEFQSYEDSNKDWNQDYIYSIKNLIKKLIH
jgi:hypothetical protein